MAYVPINTGTAVPVGVDIVGTDNIQIVKVMQATAGQNGSMGLWTVVVSGTSTIFGTVNAIPVGTANVSIVNASIGISGTATVIPSGTQNVNVVNALTATVANGLTLGATTAGIGSIVATAHPTRWNSFVVNTTSGASAIIKTSGANTLYVTSLLVSVAVPMTVNILSAATTMLSVYLATNGGFTLPVSESSPLILNSNQSLTIQGNASGSCMGWAAGITFT